MKFLVGYNGTDEAKAALSLARIQAEIFGAKVVVTASMGGGRRESSEEIAKVEQELQYAYQFLKEKNIPCETVQLARGRAPGEDLVKYAEDNDIDQIYVGIEKKSRAHKILLGSTAQYIILKAPCPVVSVNLFIVK